MTSDYPRTGLRGADCCRHCQHYADADLTCTLAAEGNLTMPWDVCDRLLRLPQRVVVDDAGLDALDAIAQGVRARIQSQPTREVFDDE